MNRRWPSAKMTSKASDDFPEPLNPVTTTSFSRGISRCRFLRLCWRAPLILITCAGILTRNVKPTSQAQLFLFSSEIAFQAIECTVVAKFRACM